MASRQHEQNIARERLTQGQAGTQPSIRELHQSEELSPIGLALSIQDGRPVIRIHRPHGNDGVIRDDDFAAMLTMASNYLSSTTGATRAEGGRISLHMVTLPSEMFQMVSRAIDALDETDADDVDAGALAEVDGEMEDLDHEDGFIDEPDEADSDGMVEGARAEVLGEIEDIDRQDDFAADTNDSNDGYQGGSDEMESNNTEEMEAHSEVEGELEDLDLDDTFFDAISF